MMRFLLPSLLSFAYSEESTCGTKGAALLQVRGDLARGVATEEEAEPELAALMEDHFGRRREEEEVVAAALALRGEELAWTSASGPCGTCQHCFIEGACYAKSPEGANATEALCVQHGGTWCPTGKGPAKVDIPCISENDFKKDSLWNKFCDLKGLAIGQGECKGGCWWSSETGHCECYDESSCKGLKGTWKVETCGSALQSWGAAGANVTKAKAAGSCGNLTLMGRPLGKMVGHFASHCCASAPKTVCEPNAELTTPCGQSADFDRLANFSKASCFDVATQWERMNDAIKKAKAAKTCDNTAFQGGPLEQAVSHYARRCCKNPYKTVCNPTGEVLTPCQDGSALQHNATLYQSFSCIDLSVMLTPALKKARAQGSCRGLKTHWGNLSDVVSWGAPKCCKGPAFC